MRGIVAFPLSDGQVLTIRIAYEAGDMHIDHVREGSILWGFDAFLGNRVAKHKYCEDVLAWPFRNQTKLKRTRLEVSTGNPRSSGIGENWLGESFGLACAIAFAQSQCGSPMQTTPTVIATGIMKRDGNHLLIEPVDTGLSFTRKLAGVLRCETAPDYFIYPAAQPMEQEHRKLLKAISRKGIRLLPANTLQQVCEQGICQLPAMGKQGSYQNIDTEAFQEKDQSDGKRDKPVFYKQLAIKFSLFMLLIAAIYSLWPLARDLVKKETYNFSADVQKESVEKLKRANSEGVEIDTDGTDVKVPYESVSQSAYSSWLKVEDYQDEFDRQISLGNYPSVVEGRCHNNKEEFRGKYLKKPSPDFTFRSHHGLVAENFEQLQNMLVNEGYSVSSAQNFNCNGLTFHQGVWILE